MRCKPHHHPCNRCGTKTECGGEYEQNYDGWPEVVCEEQEQWRGQWWCDYCGQQIAADALVQAGTDAALDGSSESLTDISEGQMGHADLDNTFTYHAPKADQPERYIRLREKAKELAALILEVTPQSREQSVALTNVQQASMWANAAIAINE